MKKINACIFDLDGVIVDTAKYHLKAWNKMAHQFDYELTDQDEENLKGVSRIKSLEYILDQAGKSVSEDHKIKLAAQKNENYLNLIKDIGEEELLPGVKDFILELQSNHIKIGLGSASKNAKFILKQSGIIDLFDALVDGNDTTKSKPDPQVFLLGSDGLNVPPQEIVVFEDSAKGLTAAIEGGFMSVGIGTPENLGHADLVIAGFDGFSVVQMLNFYKEQNN